MPEDDCFYAGEYTARSGFGASEMNQLITNLKKPPSRQGRPEWRYKLQAIRQCAVLLRQIKKKWVETPGHVLVPVPPSKATTDPEYDDRMLQVLKSAHDENDWNADIREMVNQRQSMAASHESDERASIDELVQNYEIDQALAEPAPDTVVIVDDMLTTGRHFKAMQRVLETQFPGIQTIGVFISRRVPQSDFEILCADDSDF